ncbi:MAG: NAD(P)H-dependent oxidoreductase [bacterium]
MLIIYAHPNKDGHCGCFLKNIEVYFKEKNISYELIDLYLHSFNPVLKHEEHYTSGHYDVNVDVKEMQEKIKNTDKLIFIYPTWWQNMPAILKGFIDRVFIPKFAFLYEGSIPKGLLKGKKAVLFTSTGAPRIFTKIIAADRSVKVLKKDVLWFCGVQSKAFIADKASKLTDQQETKIKKLVEKGIKYLLEC